MTSTPEDSPPISPACGRPRHDRGASVPEYVAILALIAAVCASIFVLALPDQTSFAICNTLQKINMMSGCARGKGPGGTTAQDPDEPRTACTKAVDSKYLEETFTIPTPWKGKSRTNSRGTVQLVQKIGADGKVSWEVNDFTWGEAGVHFDFESGKWLKFGIWGGGEFTNGNVYSFKDEAEARKFFDDLVKHRIGNTAKFVVRTNPVTGGFSWLVGKIPWVGDKYEDWMGASEPDKEPSADYHEGGPTAGAKLDLTFGKFKDTTKTRGFIIDGTRTDHKTGERTTYYSLKGEGENSLVVDLGDVWKVLPKGTRDRVAAGAADALELFMTKADELLGGQGVVLLPEDRAQLKAQIKVSPSFGINVKVRTATSWSTTEDKDGKPLRMTKSTTTQYVLYTRLEGKAEVKGEGKVGGGKAKPGKIEPVGGKQWILASRRITTDKTLDLTDPTDAQALEKATNHSDIPGVDYFTRFFEDLDKYFDAGGGRQSRLVYDVTGDTGKADAKGEAKGKRKWGGFFESSREHEQSTLTKAEFYKPGQGWVEWKRCLG
ncbi:hypothetical protein [Actinomadura roseirufa]|uniref:hypothetical protein n=1 Tax=Actinomadura roseirufa TaxID=2094049 RepID=UPI00104126EB|nr:hypothetical protein [Actinomadura roseirufa]